MSSVATNLYIDRITSKLSVRKDVSTTSEERIRRAVGTDRHSRIATMQANNDINMEHLTAGVAVLVVVLEVLNVAAAMMTTIQIEVQGIPEGISAARPQSRLCVAAVGVTKV